MGKRRPVGTRKWTDREACAFRLSEAELDEAFVAYIERKRSRWARKNYAQKREWYAGRGRRPWATDGKVYFLLDKPNQLVKIGFSRKVRDRVFGVYYQHRLSSHPDLLLVIEGGRDQESWLHSKFMDLHAHGEWFHYREPLISFIDQIAALPEEQRLEAAR